MRKAIVPIAAMFLVVAVVISFKSSSDSSRTKQVEVDSERSPGFGSTKSRWVRNNSARTRVRDRLTAAKASFDAIGAKALEEFAATIGESDLPQILEALENSTMEFERDVYRTLMAKWARCNLSGVMEWTFQRPQERRESAIHNLASVLNPEDFADVRIRARSYDRSDRVELMYALTLRVASIDPDKMIDSPAEPISPDAVADVASRWAARSPEHALEWSRAIDDTEPRDLLLSTIAKARSATDAKSAVDLATREIADLTKRREAVHDIVQNWSQTDPRGAADWAARSLAGPSLADAMREIVIEWTRRDPSEASSWLNEVQSEFARDRGIHAFVNQVAEHFPADALAWANAITDDALRNDALSHINRAR